MSNNALSDTFSTALILDPFNTRVDNSINADKIDLHLQKRGGKKAITIISGVPNCKKILRKLRVKLSCGGSTSDDIIQLQGDVRVEVREFLIKAGYDPETIFTHGY
jgi:translation initiation factor 1 (eIF-1/SUI1)